MVSFEILWLGWLALFLVIEGIALMNKKPGDTLSEYFWKWFSIKHNGRHAKFRRLVALCFLAWLLAHFLSGGLV